MAKSIQFFRFVVTVLTFCSIGNLEAQTQREKVEQKFHELQLTDGLTHAGIGYAISDKASGKMLFQSEMQLSLVPASIMKVVTTATALEVFGPDFQFTTSFAYSGLIRNDTLLGDLVIVGGGDPTLGSKYFPETISFLDQWSKSLLVKNIKVVTGNLIIDASIYEQQAIPGGWVWDDIGNYYGAGASGISVYDNLYEIHLKSEKGAGQPTQLLSINPEIPGLEIHNEVVSSEINSDQAYVYGSPLDFRRIIRGTIPKNKSDFIVKASVPDPSALLANVFRKKMTELGILIAGQTKYEKARAGWILLAETKSPLLRDIIKVTNFESVNLFAEHFLKHLAYKASGFGTTIDGCKAVMGFWKEKGIDMTGFYMADGSGLSRFNAITAFQMEEILKFMRTKGRFPSVFLASLPSAGKGTLTVFKEENFPDDCLHAKSGSMTRVRCYAGYLATIGGQQLFFSILLNNFSCTQTEAIKKIEEILIELRKL